MIHIFRGKVMKKKIMVVDDHLDQTFTLKQALEENSNEFEVIGVNSGEKCLEILKCGNNPDIILTESFMSGMNGWELLEKLKKNPEWKKIQVAFLTAWEEIDNNKFKNSDIEGFFQKPFDINHLTERINTIMKK